MIKKHPAETGGILATAIAMLVAQALGVTDADTIMYIAVVVAGVPAGITWLIEKFRGQQPLTPDDEPTSP